MGNADSRYVPPTSLAGTLHRTGGPRPARAAIPSTLAGVSPPWLSTLLSRKYPGVEVIAANVSDHIGYKPNKARVQLTYNDAGREAGLPTSMIVKGGFKGEGSGGELTGLDIGLELELMAYAEVVPHLDVNTPHCFGVDFDAESYNGAMLLEDLAPSGVNFLNHSPGLSFPQAAAFLDAMARYHAQWLASPDLAAGGRFGPESGIGQRTQRLHTAYLDKLVRPEFWDRFVNLPRGAQLPRLLQDAHRMAAAQEKMNELHRACARTIVHGDEHLGNLFIEAKGKPGFIDWCSRCEPWVIGFTYFFLSTVDALDRRHWERPLLQHYLERLTRYGAERGAQIPGFDEAWYLYRCTAVFPFLTWFNNSAQWQPESVNTRATARAALAVIDHDSFGLLGV